MEPKIGYANPGSTYMLVNYKSYTEIPPTNCLTAQCTLIFKNKPYYGIHHNAATVLR